MREGAARRAQAEVERAKGEVGRERVEALRALEERAAKLATSIAERLLGEAIPDSDAPFLWRTTASIDALEPARKTALGSQVAHREGRSVVLPTRSNSDAGTVRWLGGFARWKTGGDVLRRGRVAYRGRGAAAADWRLAVELAGVFDRIRAELEAHAAAA